MRLSGVARSTLMDCFVSVSTAAPIPTPRLSAFSLVGGRCHLTPRPPPQTNAEENLESSGSKIIKKLPILERNETKRIESSRPVERRGREIGALFHRRVLNPESNLCYGEGGAGTWSDGKLTTRIGRNSDNVRKVWRGRACMRRC